MTSSLVSAALWFVVAAAMAVAILAHHDPEHPLATLWVLFVAGVAVMAGIKDVVIYRWERSGR